MMIAHGTVPGAVPGLAIHGEAFAACGEPYKPPMAGNNDQFIFRFKKPAK